MGSGSITLKCPCGNTFQACEDSPGNVAVCPRCQSPLKTTVGETPVPDGGKSDVRMEKILLEKGWITQEQLRDALRKLEEERKKGGAMRLGQALVEAGAVTTDQVRQALALQGKIPMRCPSCRKGYNVRGYNPERLALCPKCQVPLHIPVSLPDTVEDTSAAVVRREAPGEAVDPALESLVPGYRIERKLGSGGMGDVYLARQLNLDRPVAIKILPEDLTRDKEYVTRFLSEARSAAKMFHENLVTALDAGESNGRYYFVMEFVAGDTLLKMMEREGPIPEKRALEIARQVARGLQQAYLRQLIHRDIKPANIMITPEGTAKICDFGLARDVKVNVRLTQDGNVHSSPAYASPEQCRAEPMDLRSDMYSLGVTLFEMLTWQLPFKARGPQAYFVKHVTEAPPSPRSINPSISPSAEQLVLRLLRKQPQGRFKNYDELVAAIDAVGKPRAAPAVSRSVAAPARGPDWGKWSLVGGGVALGMAVLIILVMRGGSPVPSPAVPAEGAEESRYDEACRLQAESAGSPSKYPATRERLKALEQQYLRTPHHARFAGLLLEFEATVRAESEAAAEVRIDEARRLADGQRLPEAIRILRGFEPGYADTPGWDRVASQAAELEALLEKRFRAGVEAAYTAVASGKFEEARRLVHELRSSVTLPGPRGVEYASNQYQAQIEILSRKIEEERLLALSKGRGPAEKPEMPAPTEPAPADSTPQPSPPPSAPKNPVTPPRTEVPPAAKRLPEPEAAAQKKLEAEIRDIFKEEYARRSPADQKALATKLLRLASETKDDPVSRFVLLREARDLASRGGDHVLASQAVRQMSRDYEVSEIAMNHALLDTLVRNARTPEEMKYAAEALLKLVDDALSADDLDSAGKAAESAAATARKAKDIPLVSRVDAKAKEVAEVRAAYEGVRKAREVLAAKPDDPPANLLVGRFQCLVKGCWNEGLPFLAKGSDMILKAQAAKDLARPAEPSEMVAVGDGWWNLSEKEDGAERENLRRRAAFWYEQAVPSLTGIHRTRIEKRMSETGGGAPAASDWISIRDPRAFGLPGNVGEPMKVVAPSGDSTVAKLEPFPRGTFGAVSLRIQLPPAGNVQAILAFEAKVYAFCIQRQQSNQAVISRLQGEEWINLYTGQCPRKLEYLVTVKLVGREYSILLDDREIKRVPANVDRIQSLWLQASWNTVVFDEIRLHKKP